MRIMIRMAVIWLALMCTFGFAGTLLETMTLTTIPAPASGLPQDKFAPVQYKHQELPFSTPGYYSLEGTIVIDSSLQDPGLYIGSTAYPLEIHIGTELVYRWGDGENSKQFADYRSHGVGIDHKFTGPQKFRLDFWCNGETFVLPAIFIGERNDVVNRSAMVSFFNIHLLNGILVAAVFIAILFGGTYLISGRKEREILYFALFSVTLVFALLIFPLNIQYFDEIPLFKLARIGSLFLPFWMLQFVRSYTVVWDKSRLLFWIPLGITLLVSILIAFADNGKVGINAIFNSSGNIVLMSEFILVLIILTRAFVITKKIEIAVIFFGFLSFIAFVIHDIYYLNSAHFPLFWWISYGYLLITMSMVAALMMRQRKAYSALFALKSDLQEANYKVALESNSREKFIQTIAHELRTPLHGMDTGLRALSDRLGTEQVDQLISSGIFSSFHRLKITLQNIFGYVAAEDGKLRIVSYRFHLRDMLEELKVHFEAMAEEKGISFTVIYGTPDMPEQFRGDRDHIQLALANIMFNAVKYTEEGGVTCNVSYHNGKLICSIADTGCGLKTEMRDALFEAFHRSDSFSFSQRYEGVGLGLAITDSIVKAMSGKIMIESICDRGTSVIISVPLVADYSMENQDLSDFAVLIVDDNRVNCQLLSLMVRKMGCSTALAFNGEEAVRYQKKHRYNLILMDIQMPVMDGLTATAAIREFDKTTPIIAVTANADCKLCMNAGMSEHLSKPVNYEHLRELMTQFLY